MRRLFRTLGAAIGLALAIAAPGFAHAAAAQVVVPGAPSIGGYYGIQLPPTPSVATGNSYVAHGVHMDWQNSLLITSGSATCTTGITPCTGTSPTPSPLVASYGAVADTAHFTVSYWFRGVPYTADTDTSAEGATNALGLFASNQEVNGDTSETAVGFNTLFDHSTCPGQYGCFRINLGSEPSGSGLITAASNCDAGALSLAAYTNPGTNNGVPNWTHILISFDGTPNGQKALTLYVNGHRDTDVSGCTPNNGFNAANAFLVAFSNPNGFVIGQQTVELADVQVDLRRSIVCTDVGVPFTDCPGPNQVGPSELARAIDINGNPVDPGSNCQNLTGEIPEICRVSDGTPGSFAVEKGTVTNTFVAQNLFNASTGPGANGQPSHTAFFKGFYGDITTSSGGASPYTTVSTGLPVKKGDLILVYLRLESSSGSNLNFGISCPTSAAGSFTPIASPLLGGAVDPANALICYRIAAADNESDVVTWTWTTAYGRGGEWWTGIVGNVNQTTPIGNVATAVVSGTSFTAPSVNATAAGQSWVTVWDSWPSGQTFSIPTTPNLTRIYTGGPSTNIVQAVNVTPTTGAGATGTQTSTTSKNDAGLLWSFIINPN